METIKINVMLREKYCIYIYYESIDLVDPVRWHKHDSRDF